MRPHGPRSNVTRVQPRQRHERVATHLDGAGGLLEEDCPPGGPQWIALALRNGSTMARIDYEEIERRWATKQPVFHGA